jgi:hypothetical protein
MKNVMILLGNGFTISFLSAFSEEQKHDISVSNLFKNGEDVPWPGDDKTGFLSYKHCPNLWLLGARPYLTDMDSLNLIEDVITCANIFSGKKKPSDSIYFKAYKELVEYLSALFIYYDSKIEVIRQKWIDKNKWNWLKYFQELSNSEDVAKVHIVTFNYDIWLERLLKAIRVEFNIVGFENKEEAKFQIYKPHGSISFQSKQRRGQELYSIDYSGDIIKVESSLFEVKYKGLSALNYQTAIIPPAGDSSRMANYIWANDIRAKTVEMAKSLTENDELIISGISYWHVDRLEIDTILTNVVSDISTVRVINPNPPRTLNAVLVALFKNVIFDTHCNNLNK